MRRSIRTELLKLRTIRSPLIAVASVPVIAAMVTVVNFGAAGNQGNPPLGGDSLSRALAAPVSVVTLVALMLGVLAVAGEYRHQTITTTFLASPRRQEVLAAKLVAHALLGAAVGVLSIAAAVAVAVPWLRGSGVALHVGTEVLRIALAAVVSSALHGALGVSIGALLRNPTAAASVVLLWLLAGERLLSTLLGSTGVARWLPAAAGRALVHVGHSSEGLGAAVAASVLVFYVGALAFIGARLTLSRDIT